MIDTVPGIEAIVTAGDPGKLARVVMAPVIPFTRWKVLTLV
jgi:hypothetical protein